MITPFSYLLFLFSLLFIYLGFLILPRGFKAQYCLGSRRRYRRKWRRRSTVRPKVVHQDEETPNINDNSRQENIYSDSIWSGVNDKSSAVIHPPPNNVNVRSLLEERVRRRLGQAPGLKLIAHGIKVRPRPVWIQLHVGHNQNKQGAASEFHNCLTWRAELKTSSQEGTLFSNTPCLGSIRKVSLTDIVGFELGQKTVALKRLSTKTWVRESECFSILTNAGTLDLQCVSSSDMGGASAEDVRETFLHYLASVLSSSNCEVETILSAKTNTNTVSTVSF
jgi:hypothetical protein